MTNPHMAAGKAVRVLEARLRGHHPTRIAREVGLTAQVVADFLASHGEPQVKSLTQAKAHYASIKPTALVDVSRDASDEGQRQERQRPGHPPGPQAPRGAVSGSAREGIVNRARAYLDERARRGGHGLAAVDALAADFAAALADHPDDARVLVCLCQPGPAPG